MDQFKQLLDQLSTRQKILIVVVACLVAGTLFFGHRWNTERDLRPLFTNLAADDAGAVVEKLRTSNVEFKVADNGTILVPSARVAELRLDMASAGLPKSGRLGFELFDKQNFGASEFDEQVRFRRALEGELERSVMTLSGVESARVHVTFAKDSVFSDLRQPAKASVLVKLRPNKTLSAQNISSIEHLAASAVEGLQPEAVSVVDMNGNLLGKPRGSLDTDAGASSASLEYRQSLEHDLLAKIRSTLDPLLGSEKYRAGVTLECDFTSGEQSEETFDPDHSVILTAQKSEDSAGSTSSGGVPGTASNLPRPVPASTGGRGAVSRKTENVAYQTSRVVKHLKLPQGSVKRVSVAILLDQGLRWEGAGPAAKRVLDPPSAETLKVVKDVVSGVIGFQQDRGDQVLVETLPFDATLAVPAPEAPNKTAARQNEKPGNGQEELVSRLKSLPRLWLIAGGCTLLVVLVVVSLLIRALFRKRAPAIQAVHAGGAPALTAAGAAGTAQLPHYTEGAFEAKAMAQLAENRNAQQHAEDDAIESLRLIPTTRKSEVYRKFILEEAKKDPSRVAQLIRSWLNAEGA
jgi:flagellar M-ring protein FliF